MSPDAGGEVNQALSPDFVDFIHCLNEREVAFVLVGAVALGVHGVVRATGELEVLYRPTRANVRSDALYQPAGLSNVPRASVS